MYCAFVDFMKAFSIINNFKSIFNWFSRSPEIDSTPVTFLASRKVYKSFKNKENKNGSTFSPRLTPLSHAK
jgi:hypothetical protein